MRRDIENVPKYKGEAIAKFLKNVSESLKPSEIKGNPQNASSKANEKKQRNPKCVRE